MGKIANLPQIQSIHDKRGWLGSHHTMLGNIMVNEDGVAFNVGSYIK